MRQIASCYCCTTPLQLFGALSLAVSRNETADLYIDPQFAQANHYAESIKKTGVFDSVRILDTEAIKKKFFSKKNKIARHLSVAWSYIAIRSIGKSLVVPDTEYQNVFFSSRAYFPRLIYLYLLRNKQNPALNYFDDGVGSYCDGYAFTPPFFDRILRRILFGKNAVDETNRALYLFAPEVHQKINPESKLNIRKIPALFNAENGIQIMKDVFFFQESNAIKEKTIILDSMKEDIFTEKSIARLLEIYQIIGKKMGMDNVLIKSHPRDTKPLAGFTHYYQNSSVIFEVECFHPSIADKLIVSYGSTAATAPKIMAGSEPYVILLYKLIPSKNEFAKVVDMFFEAVRDLYSEKKMFIPKSMDELEDAMNEVVKHGSDF